MRFLIGDKVLFKRDKLKGEVIFINSLYKVTVLTQDGFEMLVSVSDLVNVEVGTDTSDSYGNNFFAKEQTSSSLHLNTKNRRKKSVLKIDLHINLLISNYKHLDNFEIVQIQLSECKKKVDLALNSRAAKLIIIHGIGAGVLKREVHKLLDRYNLRYYLTKDAGATEVIF